MTDARSIRLNHFEGCLLSLSIGYVLIEVSAERMADVIRAHFRTTKFQTVRQIKEISA